MNINNVIKGTVLVPSTLPQSNCMGSAIQCLEAGEKGFKFRRMNITHNLEEFFMARNMLETSQWDFIPDNSQLVFL